MNEHEPKVERTSGKNKWGGWTEYATAEINLGGVTKVVEVQRHVYAPDERSPKHQRGFWETLTPVVHRFRTGTKDHVVTRNRVGFDQRGAHIRSVAGYRNRNTSYPVRWAEVDAVGTPMEPNAAKW